MRLGVSIMTASQQSGRRERRLIMKTKKETKPKRKYLEVTPRAHRAMKAYLVKEDGATQKVVTSEFIIEGLKARRRRPPACAPAC